jgi:hypothetical protein
MNCRWCAGELQSQPLLILRGIPQGAQSLPLKEELAQERGVDLMVHRCVDCDLVQTSAPTRRRCGAFGSNSSTTG